MSLYEAVLLVKNRREIVYLGAPFPEAAQDRARQIVEKPQDVLDVFPVRRRAPVYACDVCRHATHDAVRHPLFEGRYLCISCAGDPDGPDNWNFAM